MFYLKTFFYTINKYSISISLYMWNILADFDFTNTKVSIYLYWYNSLDKNDITIL